MTDPEPPTLPSVSTRARQPARARLAACLLSIALSPASAHAAHAVAQFGAPKYPPSFAHFDYVNPHAPRGGTLNLSIVSTNSSFDKYNPFTLKGVAAPGLLELTFETLTFNAFDEINTQYGLLAQDIEVAPDFSSATFRLDPRARFSNGDPVAADDVLHSFRTLTSDAASPRFRSYFSEIRDAVAIDAMTVRFDFSRRGRDLSFVAGSLPVFSRKWGAGKPFDALRVEAPIASGPYLIERAVPGQGIVYRRNPTYWGDAIPARKGMFNFGRVAYKLYKDADTQVAAVRAGEVDFLSETRMRYWCCQYIGRRFDDGTLVKRLFRHHNPPSMNGWVVNLRKPRFQDQRVREALNYALDFEWINRKIFDDGFERVDSYFASSPLQARGLPGPDELALLEPFRSQLPPAVFGPMYAQPTTRPPSSLRHNLERAQALFAEAGWRNHDGVLRNTQGEPFVIEVNVTRGQSPYMDPIYLNLTKLGVVVRKKLADAAATRKRMNGFDFDYSTIALREARMPGAELWRVFNSADADRPGSENIAGVKSPVIDALIRRLLEAESQTELETAARALDRVLIHGHYVIPWRYLTDHYVIHHRRLRQPDVLPRYYGANEWAIGTWWEADTPAASPSPAGDGGPRAWPALAVALALAGIVLARLRRRNFRIQQTLTP